MLSEISLSTKKILKRIYEDVYKKINENHIDVFLCGGASNKNNKSVRDLLRQQLLNKPTIRILYPEDLFMEMLNTTKEHDLLSLEKFLANNADIICIICESPGSLVELGAFTNNPETFSKVIAVIESKRKRDQSFIMMGPIKLIKNNDKTNVVFYNKNDIDSLSKNLSSLFKRRQLSKSLQEKITQKGIDTIIGQYYLIPLLIYFYKSIDLKVLIQSLQYILSLEEIRLEDKELNKIFNSAKKLLYKEKIIYKEQRNNASNFYLTDKGYSEVNLLLYKTKMDYRNKLCDKIRFDIMKEQLY